MYVCVLAKASQWDKQEMHSELELMQEMPPHLNIVNFLGKCSETGEIKDVEAWS